MLPIRSLPKAMYRINVPRWKVAKALARRAHLAEMSLFEKG